MADIEGSALSREVKYVGRAMSPHFIVDKLRDRESSRDKTYILNGSGVFKEDNRAKIYSKFSSLKKHENTVLSIGQGKNRIEEYSTQAYDLRSLRIKSKASIGEKMKSIHSLVNKEGHHHRVVSMTDHLSKNSESGFEGDTSSAMRCSKHPILTSICEKRSIRHAHTHGPSIDRHLHGAVKVKHTKRFKNKFPTQLDLDQRNSRSGARLEEESPSSQNRMASGTYYRDGREHSPEDEIDLAAIYKDTGMDKPDYSKFARAFSKTAPLKMDTIKPKNDYPGKGFFGNMMEDNISDKGDTISPNSHSKRSSLKHEAPEAEDSKDSSMDVCSPRSREGEQLPEQVDPELTNKKTHRGQVPEAAMVANKLAEQRRHIKDEYAVEKSGGNIGTIASDDLGGRDVGRKNSKVPVRRVKSILKKSRTNKPSPESSQSKSRGKQVQFNRFKEVLTYYRDKI